MLLSPMRYKDYVWPHNPRVYEIEFKRKVVAHKIPFGAYTLQAMGREHRVLRGEGEFVGQDAYDEFRKLGSLFYSNTPGILVHPVWQTSNALFVGLSVRQEPREDYVSYSFEFWECFDGYTTAAEIVTPVTEETAKAEAWYSVVSGDCLWNIAIKYGITLSALLALNPQIKNPNLIYPGDRIRVA